MPPCLVTNTSVKYAWNDAMIPINVQSVDDTEVTSRVPIGQALRPYRQVVVRKHCA